MSAAPEVLGWALRRLRPRPARGPEHRSILVVDIAGFGRWSDPEQITAREVLAGAMKAGFRAAGVWWSDLAVQDRGDGMAVLVPAWVSKVDLLDPVLPHFVGLLRRHNDAVGPDPRIRVRVSLHAGEVHRDAHGWVGGDLNTACRLVDSDPLREHLAASTGDAVLVVSDLIYQGVVRHAYRGLDPTSYHPVHIAVKEVRTTAWLTPL
ncbi:hypothetical protein [Saccharothrix coeruleofusca]|uniref:Guanylate cyclase domain-containing protein n=1 Tax=Saccharothrix coeruleofusca TaxID=33919 RepID=A0A918AN46_9PSEU|nr:hypothetical protein [Saccharothrix coeruleofusca]MBP2337990.1 hypothetical protein [Saccharothrix coeruleofusca]GGP63571.1 hypothetical protein GCM10010185_40350 [Saccharothrix coeruleofusca]